MEDEGSHAIDWLPNPPFLNLIRHLWECQEIPDILIQVWEEPITQGTIHCLLSMSRHLHLVVQRPKVQALSSYINITDKYG